MRNPVEAMPIWAVTLETPSAIYVAGGRLPRGRETTGPKCRVRWFEEATLYVDPVLQDYTQPRSLTAVATRSTAMT